MSLNFLNTIVTGFVSLVISTDVTFATFLYITICRSTTGFVYTEIFISVSQDLQNKILMMSVGDGDEKFCLKWNDFQQSISQSFQDFREDLTDVTIFCGKKKVERFNNCFKAQCG